MSVLVVDASCVAAWALEEQSSSSLEALLERIAWHGAMVPAFWALEVVNAVHSATKAKRIASDRIKTILANVDDLNIIVDRRTHEQAFTRTYDLAQRRDLSMYDAAYLELACRHGAILATLDKRLGKAARDEGLLVMPE